MQAIRSVYVSFHNIHFMQKARILYGYFRWTDPDWDGATTEQTDIHLLFLLYIYITIRRYFYNQFSWLLYKATFFNWLVQ